MKTPPALAEDLLRTLDDADSSTAFTALEIAKLLVAHRGFAQLDCDRQLLSREVAE